MYRQIAEEMLSFVQKNPTAYHTAAAMAHELEEKGAVRLLESRPWSIQPGKSYYVSRSGSSIIAFRVGEDLSSPSFNIVASHTDSPTFRLKEKTELRVNGKYTRLNVEGYGGMICSTWLDRPLSVAGRVLVRENGAVTTRLLHIDRDLLLIPSVAIHMNRSANEGFAFNKQIDLLPLFAGDGESRLMPLIAEELGVAEEDILGSDLFLCSREHPAVWGAQSEFVSSGRLDDQQCAFSSLKAFMQGENPRSINVLCCFDTEEVGSGSKQGADSTFLSDVLRRICLSLGLSEEAYLRGLASSFMLSADNAHAVHPNHPEHTDANNCTYMNEGVVVKTHAGQKYTSDGMSIALVRELAQRRSVPLQFFSNRSDKAGGSTLGHISLSHVSLNSVDIGLPQLAMHSCYETAGVKDTFYMVELMTEFYNSHFEETDFGTICIQ